MEAVVICLVSECKVHPLCIVNHRTCLQKMWICSLSCLYLLETPERYSLSYKMGLAKQYSSSQRSTRVCPCFAGRGMTPPVTCFTMIYDSNGFVSKQIGNEDRSCDEADHLMFKLSYLTHPARLRFGCSRPRWSSMPRCSDKTSSMNSVSASSISPRSTQTHHLLSTAAGYKSDRP